MDGDEFREKFISDGTVDWTTAVYTSEVGFLLHLPVFIQYNDDAYTPSPNFTLGIFTTRMLIHAVALPLLLWDARDGLWSWQAADSILYGTHSVLGWYLMAGSAFLYVVSYVHHLVHVAIRKSHPIAPNLYAASHISILNFLFDLPGRGVSTCRVTHALVIIINLLAGAVLVATWFTATPLRAAWGCYDPAFIHSLKDYNRGLCTKDANAAICAERPYTNCEQNFERDMFNVILHGAIVAIAVSLVLYTMSLSAKFTFYRVQAYAR